MINPDLPESYEFAEGMVRYGKCGSGPDVLLVHGTPWSSFCWHRMLPTLTSCYTVYYYDLIGYGRSEMRSQQNVSLAVQGQLLAELVEHWGLQRPRVVAHDFGGAIALRAHLLHQVDFEKLALIDAVALSPWGSAFFAHVRQHESAFAGVPPYIHRAIVEAYVRGAMTSDPDAALLNALVSPWLSENGQAAFYRQIAQADEKYTDAIEPLYADMRCPVSIFWGEDDAWIPLSTGVRLHESMPHSTFTSVSNAGHLAPLEASEFVNEKIVSFFSE